MGGEVWVRERGLHRESKVDEEEEQMREIQL